MKKNIIFALFMSVVFMACSGTAINLLNPNARFVRIVITEPSIECRYLGEVYGYQENTDSLNESLLTEGAINDVKNKANKVGADTVFFLSNQNKITIRSKGNNIIIDDSLKSTQEISIVALAYKCSN